MKLPGTGIVDKRSNAPPPPLQLTTAHVFREVWRQKIFVKLASLLACVMTFHCIGFSLAVWSIIGIIQYMKKYRIWEKSSLNLLSWTFLGLPRIVFRFRFFWFDFVWYLLLLEDQGNHVLQSFFLLPNASWKAVSFYIIPYPGDIYLYGNKTSNSLGKVVETLVQYFV